MGVDRGRPGEGASVTPPEATARRGYPNSAIDSTNRTRSTCREIGSFW